MPNETSLVRCNVADRLATFAQQRGDEVAIAMARPNRDPLRSESYETITFGELQRRSSAIARGLLAQGIQPGARLALLVPFGIDFICLVLGMLKASMVQILVDPGMGRSNLIECLAAAEPEGFVGIGKAQLARWVFRHRFPKAKHNVIVGARFPGGGKSLSQLVAMGNDSQAALPHSSADLLAAVIYTTGSTGPPKGVAYTHGMFDSQVRLVQQQYQIQASSIDLACFPLFGLFDAVMGVTTVIPDMDPTRPADADPQKILGAIEHWNVTQAFGSPALWRTVSQYAAGRNLKTPSLRRVLSAGAPVPPSTLRSISTMLPDDGEIFTPYGATEALPVASIESRQVLGETAAQTLVGRGTCVGKRVDGMQWRVIQIVDGPLETIEHTQTMPVGEIGELMVSGPVVSQQYVTRSDQNALHKVRDGQRVWHRMGDVGYLDQQDRFWFCGRKAHRVITQSETMYTICCEAIFNEHRDVVRCALVGTGAAGQQTPVLVVEVTPEFPAGQRAELVSTLRQIALQHPHTKAIQDIRIYPGKLPVDIRHNSKIFREQLAQWAQ